MVGGDDDIGGLLLSHEALDQGLELEKRIAACLEGLRFTYGLIAHGVDGVVVDVHERRIRHELLALGGGHLINELAVLNGDRSGVLSGELIAARGGTRCNGAVDKYIEPVRPLLHAEGACGEQGRHAAFCDRGKHRLYGVQFTSTAGFVLDNLAELLSDLVAQRIGHDDPRAF